MTNTYASLTYFPNFQIVFHHYDKENDKQEWCLDTYTNVQLILMYVEQ